MTNVFQNHEREFSHNRYVYPVVSRRSRGISIGIDLTHERCTFRCLYCSELARRDGRTVTEDELLESSAGKTALASRIDLPVLEREIRGMIFMIHSGGLLKIPPFDETPAAFRRFNDIALSGSGEPTLSPSFEQVCEIIRKVGLELASAGVWRTPKAVLITNATALHLEPVQRGLSSLGSMLEIWAKLDAGTERLYKIMNRSPVSFERVLSNLRDEGRRRPIFIQTMLCGIADGAPVQGKAGFRGTLADGGEETSAWIDRLRWLLKEGARIKGVQIYTTARSSRGGAVFPCPDSLLKQAAVRVQEETKIPAFWFGGSGSMGVGGQVDSSLTAASDGDEGGSP